MKPRLVSEADAAAYVGLDVETFRKYVVAGVLPAPLPDFGLFDLHAIDAAIDQLSAQGSQNVTTDDVPTRWEPAEPRADDVFLLDREVAKRFGISEKTLANMRASGEGIPYVKLPSGSIRYRLADVLAAERRGDHGFTWEKLRKAMKGFPGLTPRMLKPLITHVRKTMRREN